MTTDRTKVERAQALLARWKPVRDRVTIPGHFIATFYDALAEAVGEPPVADHPHADPGDGRPECTVCGKYVWPATHSCKGVPVTNAARARLSAETTEVP